jgi:death on curing protein
VEHLTVEDLLVVAETIGAAAVRDIGLLDAAAHRPRATAFGQEAYPAIHQKAAALLDTVVRHRALVDGNKRLGWAAAVVFSDLNGFDLDPPGVTRRWSWSSPWPPVTWSWRSSPSSWRAGRSAGPGRRQAEAASSSRARRNTVSSIGSVRRPVLVFCWLTW